MKKLYYIILLAMLSMTVVSCSDWDSPYYVDDILGSWVCEFGSDGYVEYDIMGFDVVRYDFYYDHTGRYSYYNDFGAVDYVDFDWETRGNRLFIRYYDGEYENLYYGYDDYGYLIMSLDRRFYQYTAYRRIGVFYEPAKELSDGAPKQAAREDGKTTAVKSVSRAIKARATDAE